MTYELNAAALGESCWSCEGHVDAAGDLCRKPRLWFYTESVVAVNLLAQHVQLLADRKLLSHEWRVLALSALHTGVECPIFSLEPLLKEAESSAPPRPTAEPKGALGDLRQDIRLIGTSMGHRVRSRALSEIKLIELETSQR